MDGRRSLLLALALIGGSMFFYAAIGVVIVGRGHGPGADVPAAVPVLVGVVALAASAALARVAAVPHNAAERFRGLVILSAAVLDLAALAGVFLTVAMWRVWPVLLLAFAGILGIAAFVLPAANEWFRGNAGAAAARGPVAPS